MVEPSRWPVEVDGDSATKERRQRRLRCPRFNTTQPHRDRKRPGLVRRIARRITVPPENISEFIHRARKIEFESCK